MFHALDFSYSGDSPRFPVSPASGVISGQAYLEIDQLPLHRPPKSVALAGLSLALLIMLLLNLGIIPLWFALVTGATWIYSYLCLAVNEGDAEIENVTPIAAEPGCIDPSAIETLMAILMRHRLSASYTSPISGLLRHEIALQDGTLTHSVVSDQSGSRREIRINIRDDRQLLALTQEIFGNDRNRVSVYTGGSFVSRPPAAGR